MVGKTKFGGKNLGHKILGKKEQKILRQKYYGRTNVCIMRSKKKIKKN